MLLAVSFLFEDKAMVWLILKQLIAIAAVIVGGGLCVWWLIGDDLKTCVRQLRKSPVRMTVASIFIIGFVGLSFYLLSVNIFGGLALIGVGFMFATVAAPYISLWFQDLRGLTTDEWSQIDGEITKEIIQNGIQLQVHQNRNGSIGRSENDVPNMTAIGLLPSSKYVFIDEKVFTKLNRDEFSSILAHELAHHDHNDQLQVVIGIGIGFAFLIGSGYYSQILFPPNIILAGIEFETLRIAFGISLIVYLIFALWVSRKQEYQADLGAVERMDDPKLVKSALGSFLAERGDDLTGDLLSTHPHPDKRKKQINEKYSDE